VHNIEIAVRLRVHAMEHVVGYRVRRER